jgi:uncharacterized protein with GYD domain
MAIFIMLTRVSQDIVKTPQELQALEQQVEEQIRSQCPAVKWVHNYAVLGPYDYVDIFEAPDTDTATKVSTLIRTIGHAHVEIWPATEWGEYKDMLRSMPVMIPEKSPREDAERMLSL